jgi:hypothetical protein
MLTPAVFSFLLVSLLAYLDDAQGRTPMQPLPTFDDKLLVIAKHHVLSVFLTITFLH